MNIATVRKAQRAYDDIHERAEAMRASRDAAIRAALEARIPQKDIMEATGLSRARLAQIKRGTR